MQPADGQQVAYGHPWVASFTVFFKVRRPQRLTMLSVVKCCELEHGLSVKPARAYSEDPNTHTLHLVKSSR